MPKEILVIAAHPDDEVLGCGATIARHVHNGDKVHVVILAEGITSRDTERDRQTKSKELSELARTAHEANQVLGASSLNLHDFPDNRMDGIELLDVVKCIEGYMEHIRPETVYTHHKGDVNIDHQVVHQAVVTGFRPLPESPVSSLLFFEVPSSTEWRPSQSDTPFTPDWFIDISGKAQNRMSFLELKLKALQVYNCEMRPWPHSRSFETVESLARWRGATAGLKAAEAFVLGRHIV